MPTATPTLHYLYLPYLSKAAEECLAWLNIFADEFTDPDLSGWSVDLEDGKKRVQDSVVHLWTKSDMDRYPMLWRNDIFEGAGDEYYVEIRFRYSDITAYGTTIALNSGSCEGTRRPASEPVPPSSEDILRVHHLVDPDANKFQFRVKLLRGLVQWNGTPDDTDWHVVRVAVEGGQLYTLYVDGVRIGSASSSLRPTSIYIGNPTIQPFHGNWTETYVDYVRVARCVEWGRP
jgi:hypothetical protein